MTPFSLFPFIFFFLLCGCASSEKELHIYSWGDYINPTVIKKFEDEYRCKVIIDTYDSNESMYSKLKAGAVGYDILFPSNYILNLLTEQEMLQDIQIEKIPNLRYLDYSLLDSIKVTLEKNSVPYMLSFSGIGYRKDYIPQGIDSWNAFGQVAWKGRMTMLNDFRETIGAGLKYLGYSINTKHPSEVEAGAEQVLKWKKNLAKFESEQYKNGIATAEFLVVHGYCGDILQVMQEDEEVNFIYPKEGAIISCDYLAIPKSAPNSELAHQFINFLYEPQINALNMSWTLFLSPNHKAYDYLDKNLRDNHVLFPTQEDLEKMELITDIGDEIIYYYHAWDKIKSG